MKIVAWLLSGVMVLVLGVSLLSAYGLWYVKAIIPSGDNAVELASTIARVDKDETHEGTPVLRLYMTENVQSNFFVPGLVPTNDIQLLLAPGTAVILTISQAQEKALHSKQPPQDVLAVGLKLASGDIIVDAATVEAESQRETRATKGMVLYGVVIPLGYFAGLVLYARKKRRKLNSSSAAIPTSNQVAS